MKRLPFPEDVMRALMLLSIMAIGVSDAIAQQRRETSYPEEAIERLRHLRGAWRMETDIINASGDVMRSIVVVDTLEWIVPDRVLGLASYTPAENSMSTGMYFYDTAAERFYLLSVNGETGELWNMSGNLDRWTITSEPKTRPNGSQVIIRFHHHDIQPNYFEATMEVSRDGGQTWSVRSRQRNTRER